MKEDNKMENTNKKAEKPKMWDKLTEEIVVKGIDLNDQKIELSERQIQMLCRKIKMKRAQVIPYYVWKDIGVDFDSWKSANEQRLKVLAEFEKFANVLNKDVKKANLQNMEKVYQIEYHAKLGEFVVCQENLNPKHVSLCRVYFYKEEDAHDAIDYFGDKLELLLNFTKALNQDAK